MDDAVIKARVDARQRAELLLELAAMSALDCASDDARQAYWTAIRIAAEKHAPAPAAKVGISVDPMTEDEALRFEQRAIPFGMHSGRMVGYIAQHNPSYLQFIAGDVRFVLDLNRYLKNPTIARECQERIDAEESLG